YRQPRLVLRGLRDRGARLVRGADQGPREVQGSDPHQIAAGGRRPRAGTAARAGCRTGTARLLPDRREDLAGPLGQVGPDALSGRFASPWFGAFVKGPLTPKMA